MKRVFFLCLFVVGFSSFATDIKLPFTFDSAKSFLASNPDVKEVSENLTKKAIDFYSAKDLPSASATLSVAKFLDYASSSNEKLDTELFAYVLSTTSILDELSAIISPKDDISAVFKILNEIWKNNPEDFKSFSNLAIAIAIVFDTQPPSSYPHAQVSEKLLPRKLQQPLDAFKMWVNDRRKGRLMSKIENLSVEELKFLLRGGIYE